MKLSILQVFAMVSILAFGCMTVAPFVQMADAGEVHEVPVYFVRLYVCEYCGTPISGEIIGSGTATITHGPDDPHVSAIYIIVEPVSRGRCASCSDDEESSS